MFGGGQKNVFGESSFGQAKPPLGLFGTAAAKGDSTPKQSKLIVLFNYNFVQWNVTPLIGGVVYNCFLWKVVRQNDTDVTSFCM